MASPLLFHVAREDGTASGPHTAAFIRRAVASGELGLDNQICMTGSADWLPIAAFAPELELPKSNAQQAPPPLSPHRSDGGGGADLLIALIMLAGIMISIYAVKFMETSVFTMASGDTFNLSKAHNQSNILAIGLTMAGSAMISLAARAGRKS